MVGIFARFSSVRGSHRRARSSLDDREVQNSEMLNPTAVVPRHGFEASADFKPVEHPNEPPDNDLPVKCPAPEPSILNDARVWKERLAGNARRRAELPVMKDEEARSQPKNPIPKHPSLPTTPAFLPSLSAPEHTIRQLLEECSAPED
ncbi:hypothetical protein EJ110_NYTH03143 [Nymphaea thermarum]|nr:hypothetical protein EJ110_NYTH03143 [Nymphaea thermarum]